MILKLTYHGSDPARVETHDFEEHIQRHWMLGNYYETQPGGLLNAIYNHEPGLVYVDVGACIGNHSLFFAAVMQAEQAIAIEPDFDNYNHLLANLNLNDLPISPIYCAAGAKEGRVSMEPYHESKNVGMRRVKEGRDVAVHTLDYICGKMKRIDVIKIDVEHYNAQVFAGMTGMLSKHRPVVYVEAESKQEQTEADAFFRSQGYKLASGPFNHTPTWEYRYAQ